MKAIILAAGKGKRLQSETVQMPKHLRIVAGKPILHYVIKAIDFIKKEDIVIVVGFLKEKIMNSEEFGSYSFVAQEEQLGTGHAVKCAKDKFTGYKGNVLVLLGDTPLLEKETLEKLVHEHEAENNACTILSCYIKEVMPLGRIVRDSNKFCGIVEDKECTPEQKNITEYNTGVMVFNSEKLFEELENLEQAKISGEYYLTDIPKLFLQKNYQVGVYMTENKNEIYGVNSIEDLNSVEKIIIEKNSHL